MFMLYLSIHTFGQSWELGGFVGTSGYMGDLNPINPFKVNNLAVGGQVKRNFDGYWSLKLNFSHGKIEAADANSDNAQFRERNLSFFSPLTEVSLQTEFNFFKYIPSFSRRRYSPYLFVGAGFVTFDPRTEFQGNVYQLSIQGTEGQPLNNSYKTLALTIPFGTGIKYNFSGKWTLGAELGYRTAYSDYLDDVSTSYKPEKLVDPVVPGSSFRQSLADRSGEVGRASPYTSGTQRGDYRKHDTYLFLGFTISYAIFNIKCPVVDE